MRRKILTKATNPVFHIHGIMPKSDMVVPFSMLLNLPEANAEDKRQLWGFIKKYAQDASPENNPKLDQAGHLQSLIIMILLSQRKFID